jgi:hypothetical protein
MQRQLEPRRIYGAALGSGNGEDIVIQKTVML